MPDNGGLSNLVDAMFLTNRRGKLTGNDAPHFYLLRTPRLVICHCHADLIDERAAELAAIARRKRSRPSFWAGEYADYLAVLSTVAPLRAVRAGPLYGFSQPAVPGDGAVATVRIKNGNAALLRGGLDEWVSDATKEQPMAAVVVDGRAVSVCASVHASETAHCAGVETLPAYRGKGLGAQAVTAWAEMVRAGGAKPFYSTTFDNVASQRLAMRLALEPVGAEFSVSLAMSRSGAEGCSRFVP